jgi:hypothetical protein
VIVAGRFELGERLGSGGAAEVHRAVDRRTGAAVAIKRLLPQLSQDRAVRQRFLREAEVARRLDHPGIVRIFDAGEDEGRPYLALELVEGEDLRRHLDRRERLPWPEARAVGLALARALEHAHQRGVVHRDVKPQNVLGAGTPAPRLTDFGLARLEALAALTGSSLVWGSPEYMAPELFGRGRADPRSDLYSLGVVLFEMVTGRLPWRDRSLSRLALTERDRPVELPSLGLGEAWDHLMVSLLSPSPSARPASAAQVIAALEGEPPEIAVAVSVPCAACGVARPEDIPVCFACGHRELDAGHVEGGPWTVMLTAIKDDVASMEAIHRKLAALTGRSDLRLKFVIGERRHYSRRELRESLTIPVKLFDDLDEETARGLARSLTTGTIEAKAVHRGSAVRRAAGVAAVVLGGLAVAVVAGPHAGPAIALGGGAGAMALYRGRRRITAARGAFRLRPRQPAAAGAARQLEAARQTSAALSAPEVRSLFIELSQEIFRLGRRAEALSASASPGSSEEVLARRLLGAAPAVSTRLQALSGRLDEIDAALSASSEGEAMRALAALQRRLADDPAALAEARQEIEAALERRHQLGDEREALASSLCRLLATTRDLYRGARQLTTSPEREAAAALVALEELERELGSAGQHQDAPVARTHGDAPGVGVELAAVPAPISHPDDVPATDGDPGAVQPRR